MECNPGEVNSVKMGIELVPEVAVTVARGDFINMRLMVDGNSIQTSLGEDEFAFTTTVLRGKRLAATGRRNRLEMQDQPLGMGPAQVPPALAVEMGEGTRIAVDMEVRNSTLLDMGMLVHCLGLRVVDDQGETLAHFPLARPDVTVSWPRRGRFLVDITKPLLNASRVA
jgi:hypothetical protein